MRFLFKFPLFLLFCLITILFLSTNGLCSRVVFERLKEDLQAGVTYFRYNGANHSVRGSGPNYVWWRTVSGSEFKGPLTPEEAAALGLNPEEDFSPYQSYGIPSGTLMTITGRSITPETVNFDGYSYDPETNIFVPAETNGGGVPTTGGTNWDLNDDLNDQGVAGGDQVGSAGKDVTPGIHAFVVRGLHLLLWALVAIITTVGCLVFGDGFIWMWREEPGNTRKGLKRMFWGFVMNASALIIVGIRLYIFDGADMTDTLAYKVWQTWMGG